MSHSFFAVGLFSPVMKKAPYLSGELDTVGFVHIFTLKYPFHAKLEYEWNFNVSPSNFQFCAFFFLLGEHQIQMHIFSSCDGQWVVRIASMPFIVSHTVNVKTCKCIRANNTSAIHEQISRLISEIAIRFLPAVFVARRTCSRFIFVVQLQHLLQKWLSEKPILRLRSKWTASWLSHLCRTIGDDMECNWVQKIHKMWKSSAKIEREKKTWRNSLRPMLPQMNRRCLSRNIINKIEKQRKKYRNYTHLMTAIKRVNEVRECVHWAKMSMKIKHQPTDTRTPNLSSHRVVAIQIETLEVSCCAVEAATELFFAHLCLLLTTLCRQWCDCLSL